MTYKDLRAERREETKRENEEMRSKLEAAERERWFDREIDGIKFGPHTGTLDRMVTNSDSGEVEPENGWDTGYDLAFSERGQAGSPSSAPEADTNPGQKPERTAAKKAAPAAKRKAPGK